MTTSTELHVDRADLARVRIEQVPVACGDGEAVLEVEQFALTANNITYAVAGEPMGYWKFFPAPAGWGRIPVWGFGRVGESRADGLERDARFYGYFPMGTHLVVQPARVRPGGFVDDAPHRRGLPQVYNQYQRAEAPDRDADNVQMLLRPLFTTSFLIDDFLAEHDFFGAAAVVLSSASSKTALGLAFELSRKRRGRVEVIGLTSPAHLETVQRTGYYDRVLTYDALESLDSGLAAVFVDMAGNLTVLRRVHEHFADRLRHSCVVGVTHWQEAALGAPAQTLPGPAPTLFFAPSQIEKRLEDWGPGGMEQQLAPAWTAFVDDARRWLHVVDVHGIEAMREHYLELLAGRTPADCGLIIHPGG
jgi:hypothetical protein